MEVFDFIEQIYNASDLSKLGALLDVVVANQERAIETFEKLTQQNLFANLFIRKFGVVTFSLLLFCFVCVFSFVVFLFFSFFFLTILKIPTENLKSEISRKFEQRTKK